MDIRSVPVSGSTTPGTATPTPSNGSSFATAYSTSALMRSVSLPSDSDPVGSKWWVTACTMVASSLLRTSVTCSWATWTPIACAAPGTSASGIEGRPVCGARFLTSSGAYDWSNDPGGQYFLNTADDAAYGTYLATVVSHFASDGVDIDQISPMNEPDNDVSGCGQEGMEVPSDERAGVIDAVGSALASDGLSTKVIADESSEVSLALSEDPTWLPDIDSSYLQAIAHHTYDNPSDSTLEQMGGLGDVNDKPVWASEICCQDGSSGYGAQYDPTITGALWMANYIYTDLSYADDSAFQWWTALSSAMGCDPDTSSSCATSINSSGWNDGLIYYDPDYASDGNQNLYISKRSMSSGSTASTCARA